jgi:acyl-CoA thioester hydrolase
MKATRFEHVLRVYWEDTDAGGVVFYANYLKYFERARTEWLRGFGFSQEAMRLQNGSQDGLQDGVMFVVSSTSVRYLSPARLDDLLQISVEPRELGRASMLLFQQAWRGERLLAQGEIRIGCVASGALADFKPTRIPAALVAAVKSSNP